MNRPLTAWPYPRVVAHRGGGTLAPENTLAGIETGAAHGIEMVEFDAKLSADNVVFLLHDDTVDRTSDGFGAAAEMSYAVLSGLDAGKWRSPRFAGERMPTLNDAAQRCIALKLAANVEIKPCPGRDVETGKRVAAEAEQLWKGQPVQPLLSSFSYEALAAARDTAPALPRGMLYDEVPAAWREQTAALGCVSLHADHAHLTQALVAQIKSAGLFMLVYTVNDPARAKTLAQWGVDSICTDRIDLIGGRFLD